MYINKGITYLSTGAGCLPINSTLIPLSSFLGFSLEPGGTSADVLGHRKDETRPFKRPGLIAFEGETPTARYSPTKTRLIHVTFSGVLIAKIQIQTLGFLLRVSPTIGGSLPRSPSSI